MYGPTVRLGSRMDERAKFFKATTSSLCRAEEMQSWGMPMEACEQFQSAVRLLRNAVRPEVHYLSGKEKEVFRRIANALEEMVDKEMENLSPLQEASNGNSLKKFDTKALISELRKMPGEKEFMPSQDLLTQLPQLKRIPICEEPTSSIRDEDDQAEVEVSINDGTLVPRREMSPNKTYLTINIDRIGLKCPEDYIDPVTTVSVKDRQGADLERPQDTPVAKQREVSYVVFGVPVEVQTPVEDMPKGAAIFFEFKHFKPKKKTKSTKCFSFLEMDEIKEGKVFLELYKKPTDYHRKKLSLFSVKPLYLHLTLSLHSLHLKQ